MFSAIVHGDKQDLTIDVAVPGISHKFTINNDNKLVLQRLEVSSITLTVLHVKNTTVPPISGLVYY